MKKHDDMDGAFGPVADFILAAIQWPLVILVAAFMGLLRAAEWAFRPRMIYATIGSLLILSLTVIWAMSRANGM